MEVVLSLLFSIIVPVYKVQEYLCQCIDSILTQSYSSFELILVDDGSPDRCPEICDEYASKDKRIKVIHQENKGLSAARNTGLKNISGDYIVFVDSDDLLYSDALLNISEEIKQAEYPDIVICNIAHWDGCTEKIIVDNEKYSSDQEHKSFLDINELYASDFVQLPWRSYQSVYRIDFIETNDLMFDESIIGAEDCDFYLRLIQNVNSFFLTKTVIVKYRVGRGGSIINSPSFKSVMGQLKTFAEAFNRAEIFSDVPLMKEYFADRYANIIMLVNKLHNQTERSFCYEFINHNKNIISYTSHNVKYLTSKVVWHMFGFECGTKILSWINTTIKKYKHYFM